MSKSSTQEPTLRDHLKRISGIQTTKKHQAQVENLKKARASREQKRRGSLHVPVTLATLKPHVPRSPRKIRITLGGVVKEVDVLPQK